jgi:hypothetical protein
MSKRFSFVLIALTAAVTSIAGVGCAIDCTEVGCPNGIGFHVAGPAAAFSGELPATLRLCVGTACHEYTLSQDGQGAMSCAPKSDADSCDVNLAFDAVTAFVEAKVADEATASVHVTGRDGNTLFEDSAAVPISPFYPNGEACGAACRSGQVVFTPTSK